MKSANAVCVYVCECEGERRSKQLHSHFGVPFTDDVTPLIVFVFVCVVELCSLFHVHVNRPSDA